MTLAVVLVTVALTSQEKFSRASFNGAATLTFTEEFDATTYRDVANTDLNWNTAASRLELNRDAGTIDEFDLTTAGIETLTSTGGFAETTTAHSLTLDSQDRQIVGFICDAGGGIGGACVSRWNGSTMTAMDGVTPGAELVSADDTAHVTYTVSIDLNPVTGQPCIAYDQENAGGKSDVKISCYTGSAWQGQLSGVPGTPDNVTATAGANENNPSIRIDSNGRAVVAYQDDAGFSADVYVSHNTGAAYEGYLGASDDQLTSAADYEATPFLRLDSSDQPNVVYGDTTDTEIYFTRLASGAYRKLDGTAGVQDISNGAGNSTFGDMALRANDNPVFVWTQNISAPNRQIWYTEWNGASLVQSDGSTAGPEVIVTGNSNGNSSLDLASGNEPALCFLKAGVDGGAAPDVYCIRHVGGTGWVHVDDRATLGHHNVSNSNAIFNGNPTIKLDSFDDVNLVYQEEVSGSNDLFGMVVVRPRINGTARSTAVDSTSDNITAATLTDTETLNGGTDSYSVSNDCSTFAAATPGSPVTFATTGSALCWQVDSNRATDPRRSPTIDTINLEYVTQATPEPEPEPGNEVIRVEGDNPTDQSIEVSQQRFTDGSANIAFIARNELMSDAFVGTTLTTAFNGPLLLNDVEHANPSIITELQRVLVDNDQPIYLLGRERAQTEQVKAELEAAGFTNIGRLGGINRNETAEIIANHLTDNNKVGSKLALTENTSLVDALSYGAIAANISDDKVDPILITDRANRTLNEFADRFMQNHTQFTSLEIVGGSAAVDETMEQTLSSKFPNLTTITRQGGENRFKTNIGLAETYFATPVTIVVASGERKDIPGARTVSTKPQISADQFFYALLLAGGLAADNNAPLIITQTATLPTEAGDYISDHAATITTAIIVGTTDQVSQAVQDEIESSI